MDVKTGDKVRLRNDKTVWTVGELRGSEAKGCFREAVAFEGEIHNSRMVIARLGDIVEVL